jgi:hypothetical protein
MLGSQDEVIARLENFLICKAAFEKALFVYPNAHLEMRQGARIILKVERRTALLNADCAAVSGKPRHGRLFHDGAHGPLRTEMCEGLLS